MVYRIHFTTEDLARTNLTQGALPMVELQLAARAFQDRTQPARLDAWRRRACGGLTREARMALSLMPPVGWSPTFIDGSQSRRPE